MFPILTEVIDRALNRLRESGYIYSDGDKYFVEESINELLPRTASGKISFHRTKAWKQVCNVLFNENK